MSFRNEILKAIHSGELPSEMPALFAGSPEETDDMEEVGSERQAKTRSMNQKRSDLLLTNG